MTRVPPTCSRSAGRAASARRAVPVAAPPRVAERVAAAPDGPVRVLHRCPETVHLQVLGRAVGVTAASSPTLPHALRSNLSSLSPEVSSPALSTAYVESGLLYLDGRALVTHRLVDVRAPRLDAVRMPRTGSAAASGTPRPRGTGSVPFPAPVPSRIDEQTAFDLVGRGDGLTPFGDDVLCGWLAAHRAMDVATPGVDEAVRRALERTTTVSATLLECALVGEVAGLVGTYLQALGAAHVDGLDEVDEFGEVATARAALTTLGHSSGLGLAHGVDLAVSALSERVAA